MKSTKLPTLLGIGAIIFWSTSIAFTRSVAEKMGTLNMAFFNLVFSSTFLLLVQWFRYKKDFFSKIAGLSFAYLAKVGSFVVVYMILFYLAIGEASTRSTVIVIGIINYLWPGFIFLLSVPILKNKARYGILISGVVVAFAGTTLALLEGHRISLAELASAFKGDIKPLVFAFVAAVSWAVYSNITRKFQGEADRLAMPVFLLAAGLVALCIQLVKGEVPALRLTGLQLLELAYLAIFPTGLAYLFWDRAMKQGNKDLVVASSYIIPLASTFISGYYLRVPIGLGFGLAAVLVIVGAVLCRWSLINVSSL
jgi:drug/metabolite transporter (DMT)-like permease